MKARAKCILLIEVSWCILILEGQILWWSHPFHPPAWKSPQSCSQTWPVHLGVELSHSWALVPAQLQKQQEVFLPHSTLHVDFAFFQIILYLELQSEHERGIGGPWFCGEMHLSDGFGELTAPQIQSWIHLHIFTKPVKVTQGRILSLEYFKAEFSPLEFLPPGEHSLECSKEEPWEFSIPHFSVGFPSCRCSGPLGLCLRCSWQLWWCPRLAGAGFSSSLPSHSCSLLSCVL